MYGLTLTYQTTIRRTPMEDKREIFKIKSPKGGLFFTKNDG